jgi:hypothetical protein
MTRWLFRLVLVGAFLALGIWGWRIFFPTPEQVVRRQLSDLARVASIAPNEGPLAKAYNSQKLASFFAPEVEFLLDVPGHFAGFHDREELMRAAMAWRSSATSLKVEFLDVSVSVAADKESAEAHLTAKANLPYESLPEVQELKVAFRKIGGKWLISRVETVKTLR